MQRDRKHTSRGTHADREGGRGRTNRRRLLQMSGIVAGAASLLGGGWAVGATTLSNPAPDKGKTFMQTQTLRPDPTFYPSPRSAMAAPAETLAYVVRVNPADDGRPDAICVVDVDPTSRKFGEPATEDELPPALKPFGAVPPLVTDIELSVDDRFLYVSCWGTGELQQYDVSDPFNPGLTGSVRLGGVVRREPHPSSATPRNGGPQMVEVSRDGKRVYVTNSLYMPWDAQFYPDGIQGWMVKLDAQVDGGMAFDPTFFLDFGDQRPHQVRLEGGDASTDSYCFP